MLRCGISFDHSPAKQVSTASVPDKMLEIRLHGAVTCNGEKAVDAHAQTEL